MDAPDTTTADDSSVPTDDDHTDDLDHRLGGTTAAQAGWEVMAPPEEDARVLVDDLASDEEEGPDAVTLGMYSDQVSGRAFLYPDEARRVADQLLEAADRADTPGDE